MRVLGVDVERLNSLNDTPLGMACACSPDGLANVIVGLAMEGPLAPNSVAQLGAIIALHAKVDVASAVDTASDTALFHTTSRNQTLFTNPARFTGTEAMPLAVLGERALNQLRVNTPRDHVKDFLSAASLRTADKADDEATQPPSPSPIDVPPQ